MCGQQECMYQYLTAPSGDAGLTLLEVVIVIPSETMQGLPLESAEQMHLDYGHEPSTETCIHSESENSLKEM